MKLDGRSLHTARQVNSNWNSLIKSEILGTAEGKKAMERTLQFQWRKATPSKIETKFSLIKYPRVLTFNKEFAVILFSMERWTKVSLVNIRQGMEVPGLSCITDPKPSAILTKDVFLVVTTNRSVLAWNVNTREMIFYKKFPYCPVLLDHHNQQVMLGRNAKLEITGTTVTETNQNPVPGHNPLIEFSHPLYYTWDAFRPVRGTLWKLEGTQFKRIGDLDNGSGPDVFYPAREILLNCSSILSQEGWKIRFKVFSTQTGQLIKNRVLSLPTALTDPTALDLMISRLAVNAKQLVMSVSLQDIQAMLVYSLDHLLSQSADQEITPRSFLIDNLAEIYLNKTSLTACSHDWLEGWLEGNDNLKFITLDFWNAEN